MRRLHSIGIGVLVTALGCADHGVDDATGGGGMVADGGGATAGAPSTGGAGGEGAETSSGGVTTEGGGGSMGTPCTPPGASATSTPTPGTCDGNAAVTCDEATSTLVTQACAADEVCSQYTLTEHVFDGIDTLTWVEGRTFDWAGCIPADAVPCDLAFNGNYWWNDAFLSECDGADKTYCGEPPLPDYQLPTAQSQVGTPGGYVHHVSCGAGMICREPLTGPTNQIDDLACFAADAPGCSDAYDLCDGEVHKQCDMYHGYESTSDCAANGNACMLGCDGANAQCVPPDTEICDPANPFMTCDTADSYRTCYNCLASTQDCSVVISIDQNGGFHQDPGECVVADAGPECVIEGTLLCDSSAPETCAAAVAKKCYGGVAYDLDCGAEGSACFVGDNGEAGCTFAGAAPCTPGAPYACDGNDLVGCCPESGQFTLQDNLACAPGYEARFSCDSVLPGFTCIDHFGFFAECNTQ